MNNIRIIEAVKTGWTLYKTNFKLIWCATFLAVLVSNAMCGSFLIGSMLVGLFALLARLLRGTEPRPTVGELFKGFDKFLPALLLVFGSGIVIAVLCVGLLGIAGVLCAALMFLSEWLCILALIPLLLAFLLPLAHAPVMFWSIMLVTHSDMDWWTALKTTTKAVMTGKFFPQILLGVVAILVGGLGSIACGVGVLLTFPLAFCIFAAGFEQVHGGGAPALPESAS